MFVEPVGDGGEVAVEVGPAVVGPRFDDKVGGDAHFFQFGDDDFGLLDGDEAVFVAVDDEGGRVVRRCTA